jgi:MerR family transcriptional regulator, heat shock protein HspR
MAKQDDTGRRRRVTHRVETAIDTERGVFMISVAAELAEMHPQTLRMYETRGLITPKRSPKKTRLYSQSDVERLRRIQRMTTDEGLNLAGVEAVLKMEEQVARMRSELERMRRRTKELEQEMNEEVERVRRSLKAELVPYGAYDVSDLVPAHQAQPVRIPVRRRRKPD